MNDVTDGGPDRDVLVRKTRSVQCQACDERSRVRLEDNALLLENVVVVGDGEVNSIEYVGVCPVCRRDICAGCAKWVGRPASIGVRGGLTVQCRVPTCPKCEVELVGKSRADLDRLERELPLVPALPPQAAREVAKRLKELCLQEQSLLERAQPGLGTRIREWLTSKSG